MWNEWVTHDGTRFTSDYEDDGCLRRWLSLVSISDRRGPIVGDRARSSCRGRMRAEQRSAGVLPVRYGIHRRTTPHLTPALSARSLSTVISYRTLLLHGIVITTLIMGETKNTQKVTKVELDNKLRLAAPGREILEELAMACAKNPCPDNTFQYAFCLSKSTEPSELRYAISILDGLVKEGYEHQLDCMLGAAYALYLLGEYDKSRVRGFQSCRTNECHCVVVL
jgi:hypothetical protein